MSALIFVELMSIALMVFAKAIQGKGGERDESARRL